MSRLNLIDKDALMDKISVFFERNEELINPSVMDCVEEIIEQAESVDAVEVVRCKDCKKYIKDFSLDLCSLLHLTKGDDFYCADGERREEP